MKPAVRRFILYDEYFNVIFNPKEENGCWINNFRFQFTVHYVHKNSFILIDQ